MAGRLVKIVCSDGCLNTAGRTSGMPLATAERAATPPPTIPDPPHFGGKGGISEVTDPRSATHARLEMPLQKDRLGNVVYGNVLFEPEAHSEHFLACFLNLDQSKQRLTCIADTQNAPLEDSQTLVTFNTTCISLVDESYRSRPKHPHCFEIHYFGDIYFFCAPSWKDMEDWIDVIKANCKISVQKTQTNPNRLSVDGSYKAEVIGGNVVKTPVSTPHSHSLLNLQQLGVPNSVASDGESDSDVASIDSHHTIHSAGSASGRTKPIMTGYCVKQGRVMKNWKRRYLVLEANCLMYYKHEKSKKPLKRIWASNINEVKVSNCAPSLNRDNLMEVVTNDRTFYIQLDSPSEMYTWIEGIRKSVNLPVKTYL